MLGLDIGAGAIKLCELARRRSGLELVSFGVMPLPTDTIVDGAIVNVKVVTEAIRELIASQRIKEKKVALSVSGNAVILRHISQPMMSASELEHVIPMEASQYIPFDLSEVQIDHTIVNPSNEDGEMDVLLVAAKQEVLGRFTGAVREAGLDPRVIDVDVFSLYNVFAYNYGSVPEPVALVNVGANLVNINVVVNGQSVFTRDIAKGGANFTEEIQRVLGVSFDEAEALKLGSGGLEGSMIPQEVSQVFNTVASQLASAIEHSLNFFTSTSPIGAISKVYLTGGPSKIPELQSAISQTTQAEVLELNPFHRVQLNERKLDTTFVQNHRHIASIAVGLGMRRFDGLELVPS